MGALKAEDGGCISELHAQKNDGIGSRVKKSYKAVFGFRGVRAGSWKSRY